MWVALGSKSYPVPGAPAIQCQLGINTGPDDTELRQLLTFLADAEYVCFEASGWERVLQTLTRSAWAQLVDGATVHKVAYALTTFNLQKVSEMPATARPPDMRRHHSLCELLKKMRKACTLPNLQTAGE